MPGLCDTLTQAVSEHLCQSCALCCDGTLFDSVPLTADDRPITSMVTLDNGSRRLPQPCACLAGTRCATYATRPLACRRYECMLLLAHRDGEVGLTEAQSLVAKARELIGAASLGASWASVRLTARTATAVIAAESHLATYFTGRRRAP